MPNANEDQYVDKILDNLKDLGMLFERDVLVGKSSTDIYTETVSGSSIAIDLKLWEPTIENISTASKYAEAIKKVSGVDYSFIVLPNYKPEESAPGVVSIQTIKETIKNLPENKKKRKKLSVKPEQFDQSVFVAMPFSDKYIDTFFLGIEPVCVEINAESVRVDHQSFTGDIVDLIHEEIAKSIILIADISESRPNVFYEMGIGKGLGKQIIQICSTDMERIPFDIRNNKTIPYNIGNVLGLRKKLSKEIKNIYKRYN